MPAAVDKKALEETAGTSGCRATREHVTIRRTRAAGRTEITSRTQGQGEPPGRRRSDRRVPVVCSLRRAGQVSRRRA